MTGDIDLPPDVEAALRRVLGAAFDAGRKPGSDIAGARARAITYGIDSVAHTWLVASAQRATGAT